MRFALVALLVTLTGCATATRVRVQSPQKTISVVFPKNLSAESIDFDVDPATGEIRFRARKLRSDASGVIDSAGGVLGNAADAVKSLAPLAR